MPETRQQVQWTFQVAACRGGISIVLSRECCHTYRDTWTPPSLQGAPRYVDSLHSVVGLHIVLRRGAPSGGLWACLSILAPPYMRVRKFVLKQCLSRSLPPHIPRSRPCLTLHCCAYFLSRPLDLRGRGDGFVTVIAMGPPTKCASNGVSSAATPFVPSGVATNPASGGTFLLAAGTSKVWSKCILPEALFERYPSR